MFVFQQGGMVVQLNHKVLEANLVAEGLEGHELIENGEITLIKISLYYCRTTAIFHQFINIESSFRQHECLLFVSNISFIGE